MFKYTVFYRYKEGVFLMVKKTNEEIRRRILSVLEHNPLSVRQISEKVESNWSTINDALEDLKEDLLVKEIVSTDKIKVYQKVTGDTYYNLPITDEQRQFFRYLFYSVIQEYKLEKKRLPKKTELAKAVVDIIHEEDISLPTVWYLYGQIPLMIADPSRDYSTSFVPEHAKKISESIRVIVKRQENKNSHQLRSEQYNKYGNKLYDSKERLITSLVRGGNEKEIIKLLSEFYLLCPTDKPEVFEFAERFNSVVGKFLYEDSFDKYRTQMIISLENVWKVITTHSLIDSLTSQGYSREELMQFYLGSSLENMKIVADECLSNLESIYFSELTEKDISLTKEEAEVRGIMSSWTGE